LVKLRQFAGVDREHHVIDTHRADWAPGDAPGVSRQGLYRQAGYADEMALERWDAGASFTRSYPGGAEIFVTEGAFRDEHGRHAAGAWLRLPEGGEHSPHSEAGCTLYIKTGGLAALVPASG